MRTEELRRQTIGLDIKTNQKIESAFMSAFAPDKMTRKNKLRDTVKMEDFSAIVSDSSEELD